MIILDNCILSDELYEETFVCDLPACKGGCCVEGDAGAPLLEEECHILEGIAGRVAPFMIPQGRDAIEKQGHWVRDNDNEMTTPLVDGKQCAYAYFDGKGIARCAIERAFEAGLIDFQKPISCHLYPIRIKQYTKYDALNYHRWPLCDCARVRGKKLKVRVYRFVEDALVRKYGREWYRELQAYFDYAGKRYGF